MPLARVVGFALVVMPLACAGSTPPAQSAAVTLEAPAPSARADARPSVPKAQPIGVVPADAERGGNGHASKVLAAGSGADHPGDRDRVKMKWTVYTIDPERLDSEKGVKSIEPHDAAEIQVRFVEGAWRDCLQRMVVGEKRRCWVESEGAMMSVAGERPRDPQVIDVEQLDIVPAPKPPPTPEDVAAAPAAAKKTKSGLAYRVLTPGTGKLHPGPTSTVHVKYTGWTTDGHMFDSSIDHGDEAAFGLHQVIKGWTEGLQLMVAGERTRFWIPADLAYGKSTRRGVPQGTLVFDVELLRFDP